MSKCYYCNGNRTFCLECNGKVVTPSPNAVNPSVTEQVAHAKVISLKSEKVKKTLYGFTSAKNTLYGNGTFIWSRPDGSEVEVSYVHTSSKDDFALEDDAKCVGEVVEYIRQGKPARY